MNVSDLIKIAKLFPKERRIKRIKVSYEFYQHIKKYIESMPDYLFQKVQHNCVDSINGASIVIDNDVATWEIEYEEEGE